MAETHPFERRMAEINIPKSQINKLIMDYLVTEGYPSAAQKFASEANMPLEVEVSTIEERVQIRDAIYRCDIQTAIELLNDLNDELLDTNKRLHFALLRLQLIELIRQSFVTAKDGQFQNMEICEQALKFAERNLAPYSSLNPQFKHDLERAMMLMIVPTASWTKVQTPVEASHPNEFGALAELVDPALRQKVAKDVMEAIRVSSGEKREANIRDLVRARAWAENLARDKKLDLPEKLSLGFDGEDTNDESQTHNGGPHSQDTEMAESGDQEAADLARYTNIGNLPS